MMNGKTISYIAARVLVAAMLLSVISLAAAFTAYASDTRTVTNWVELEAALNDHDVSEIIISGHIITEDMIFIEREVTFSGSGTLDADGGNFSVIIIGSGGHLALACGNSITITGGFADFGGGVSVDGGIFTMHDGIITDNNADEGGGVSVADGTFTMHGGEISGNTANFGGGVNVLGGGVNVLSGGTFTMHGGIITGNNAYNNGGGVEVFGSTFIMHGGEISGNTASVSGGGVNVIFGTLTIHGGEISGNTADRGCGVFVENGGFNVSGRAELDGEIAFNARNAPRFTITETGVLTVPASRTLTFADSVALINNGMIANYGTVVKNGFVLNNGTIMNNGTVENNGIVVNDGTIRIMPGGEWLGNLPSGNPLEEGWEVPQTGIADLTAAMAAMLMFSAISAGLWAYVLRRRKGRQ